MTREKMLSTALLAGGRMYSSDEVDFFLPHLEDFVRIIEADVRERCAKVCEGMQDWPEGATPYDCAAAIRAARDHDSGR